MTTPNTEGAPAAAGSIAEAAAGALTSQTSDVPAAPSAAAPDVPAASSTATPDVPAAPSPADVERKTLLEVAREAIAPATPPAQAPSSQPKEDQPKAADAAPTDTPAEPPDTNEAPKDDDYSDVRNSEFGKHPRFKQLLSEVKELRALRPQADQYQQIQGFMQEHGLSAEQVAQGYTLMAMVQRAQRGDREAAQLFLKEIAPIRDALQELTGERISDDLRPKVDAAELDEATAKELTKARAENRALEQQRDADRRAQQEQEHAALVDKAKQAVADWDAQTRSRDPDYSRKEPFVLERMQVLATTLGRPKTPEEAVKLVKQAYDDVSSRLTAFVPKPQPTAPTPPAAGASRPSALPPPNSLREVAERALVAGRS